nr:permease [Bifidobacterium dentium]
MSEDRKAMRRLRILKWAFVTILILCLADIGCYDILSMVGKIKADWLSACADVAYLLIWPSIMRSVWQIDKGNKVDVVQGG